MWRERRWAELLVLIDWLPRHSAFMQAISDDEEFAELVLTESEKRDKFDRTKQPDRRPKISEWDLNAEKLTDIVDRLGELMQATVAAAGGKPPKVRPQPRPKTAIDKLREKRRYEHHRKVVSRVLIQQEDGTVAPLTLGPPPKKRVPPAALARPAKVRLAPGDDPFRLKAPRRQAAEPEGRATGEPLK